MASSASLLILSSSQVPSIFFCCYSKQAPSFTSTMTTQPNSTIGRLRSLNVVSSHNAPFVKIPTSLSLRNKPKDLILMTVLRSNGSEKAWLYFSGCFERIHGEPKLRKSQIVHKSFLRAEVKRIRASKTTSSSLESLEIPGDNTTEAPKSKRRATKKSRGAELVGASSDSDEDDYDEMMDFPYESPGLICCFGAAQREFVPTVRVSERQMHPDIYSTWKGLQWSPPEFVRAPGGPPFNVAIAHVRLGGRAAFMGKVGDDDFGNDLVYKMNTEKVQTRAVKIDPSVKTAISYMKIVCKDGKLSMEIVKECAEDSLQGSELNLAVLKEAKIFHFNSEVLTSPSMPAALFKAIRMSKKFGGLIFFDLNLPLPLWRSREETMEVIREAWNQANIIELTKQELEFLLGEEYYEKKREYRPQYYAESYEQTKRRRDYYHYTREEISSLWHDNLKILFVSDGLFRTHYYTPHFDGAVIGTEDVLITPFTCDRTGSGDALVAGIMRKLIEHPEVYVDQDKLERNLRFAIAAGIISHWTIGAVRGFPTESATQNLKEQVYVPSLW